LTSGDFCDLIGYAYPLDTAIPLAFRAFESQQRKNEMDAEPPMDYRQVAAG
jgi:hypothetical protein